MLPRLRGDLVLHVPHASVALGRFRSQFTLAGADLRRELLRVTDRYTDQLARAVAPSPRIVRFGWSRLVVDVERFRSDADEVMAPRGLGVLYARAHDGRPLRRALTAAERADLLALYDAHHARLAATVGVALRRGGTCLLVDFHSFPSAPLPCDLDQQPGRPDICLGTDPFHTPRPLLREACAAFERAGWTVAVDRPYAGVLVPAPHCRRDARVRAIMVEVNRSLYMDEQTGERLDAFEGVRDRIAAALTALAGA